MHTATIISNGQITLPLAARQALGLHTGTRLDFAA
jgi:AbrB family looped-hinge helix DNA binding protein